MFKIKYIAVLFFIASLIIYYFSSEGATGHNHFSYLADAFLNNQLYVSLEAPWLEQVPIDSSHFYVPYPPMPAILLMPFRMLVGNKFVQDYLGYLLAAGATTLIFLISQNIKKDLKLGIWAGGLAAFGTIVWFMASVSSSWYLGQLCAYFFLIAAIYESLNRRRFVLIGILLGASYLSRIETIITLPLFMYFCYDKNWFRNYIYIALGIIPFILFNFYYNFARFGVIWDKAYTLIPGVDSESWFDKGLVHLSYIPRHLEIIFSALPSIENKFPFVKPGFGGLAIWFTTPAFIYSLRSNLKEGSVLFSWLAIFLVSVIIFSHGSTGFAQFGYRFAVDFYPFLLYLTIKGAAKTNITWHHWLLLLLSITVNLWGVLWINKFGWV